MTEQLKLTEMSALELAEAIRSGQASSREIVDAHIDALERAALNAVVVERYEQARDEADALDRRIADGVDELPPLAGVPCTIKESFAVAGLPNSSGLVARRDHRAEANSTVAERLLAAGPILLGLTNLSELTMWIESDNRVYGRTDNAYDRSRTAGGSSGGEGAAIGCGGSPIGVGTDFAGSLRLPAFYNGVFGHKPTSGAIPQTGHFPSSTGEAMRMSAAGPLARRAEDLMPLLRQMAGPDGEDAFAVDIDFGDPEDVELDGLEVVISEGASFLPVRRELREARERAAGALAALGANVRRERMPSVRRAAELFMAAAQDGAGISLLELIVPEGAEPPRMRDAIRRRGDHTLATVLTINAERWGERMPQGRTRKALAAGKALTREIEGVIGDGVLLHPPHPRVAPKHGRTIGRPWVLAPTAVFNLTGLPATQIPLGLNRKGLPLGVQAVAGPGRDHVSIATAIALERVFGGWVPPWEAAAG